MKAKKEVTDHTSIYVSTIESIEKSASRSLNHLEATLGLGYRCRESGIWLTQLTTVILKLNVI